MVSVRQMVVGISVRQMFSIETEWNTYWIFVMENAKIAIFYWIFISQFDTFPLTKSYTVSCRWKYRRWTTVHERQKPHKLQISKDIWRASFVIVWFNNSSKKEKKNCIAKKKSANKLRGIKIETSKHIVKTQSHIGIGAYCVCVCVRAIECYKIYRQQNSCR